MYDTITIGTLLAAYGNNTFDYDADGIRTKKNSTTFTYVDDKLIRQTGGGATIDFIYGASGVVGFKYNNNIYIYRRNLMGDVTHIYDTNGTLKAKYIYDAWGNHRIVTDIDNIATINPIRYRGYYYDTETGLYYLKARYYDPETGRFISQDDMAYIVSEHLMGLNLYAYCNNNPVMFTDDSGCLSNEAKWLIGGAVIALLGVATLVTGGAAAGVVGFIAAGALKGAIIGAVSSALISGTISGISSAASGDSFLSGFANGAADGFMIGSIIGGASGAIGSSIQVANAAKSWVSTTGKSSFKHMTEHYTKHVIKEGQKSVAKNIVNYTKQARQFYAKNSSSGYLLRNGVIKIAGAPGGIFNIGGQIRSFWYI